MPGSCLSVQYCFKGRDPSTIGQNAELSAGCRSSDYCRMSCLELSHFVKEDFQTPWSIHGKYTRGNTVNDATCNHRLHLQLASTPDDKTLYDDGNRCNKRVVVRWRPDGTVKSSGLFQEEAQYRNILGEKSRGEGRESTGFAWEMAVRLVCVCVHACAAMQWTRTQRNAIALLTKTGRGNSHSTPCFFHVSRGYWLKILHTNAHGWQDAKTILLQCT